MTEPGGGAPLHVETWPLARLIPYARNARTHSAAQVEQLVASMREYGWTNPMLIAEDGTVIAGHGRLQAAIALGKDTAPVIVAKGWTEAQRRAYTLADNKLALNAGWDEALLALELGDLKELGVDLGLTGFADGEIRTLFARHTTGLTDPDEAPALPEEPVSRLGDVWVMDAHRLLCGDSTKGADVARLLGDSKPHLMVTDPPYGVEYDADWRNRALRSDGTPIAGRAVGPVTNDNRADWREAWALFPGDVAYVWHASLQTATVLESLDSKGLPVRALIVWGKQQFVIGRGHYHNQHEPCWYAVRDAPGATGHWQGDRTQSTLWQIDKPHKSETGHSTQKPIECMRRPIENNSAAGDAVYDPFLGSGTTIIAAETTGRACLGMELSPAYVDVCVERWQNFTGKAALLEGGTMNFAAVKAHRTARDEGPQAETDVSEADRGKPRPSAVEPGRARARRRSA